MKKYILLLLLTAIVCGLNTTHAQRAFGFVYEATGNDTIPLPGVNVYWQGTTKGTVSDHRGAFSLATPKGAHHLIFSFVGYSADTIHYHADGKPLLHVMSKPLQLTEVEVATRAKTNFVSRLSTVNATHISSGELQRAACCNLSESFETSASVDVSYSDAVTGAKQIEMLGLAGIYTQMMTENIPGMRGLANSFGLMYIPGSWMESIQVSKGTSSVLNGFESISGQINVEFKKPHQSERFFLNLFQSHAGRSEGNFNLRLDASERLKTMLLGHVSHSSARHDGNKDGFLDEPLYTQYNFFNRWDYNARNFEFQFGLKALREDRQGGQLSFDPDKARDLQNGFGVEILNERMEAFLKTGYIFQRPATSIGLQQQFTYHNLESSFGLRGYNASQQSYYANLLFQSFIGNTMHNYTTGMSFLYDHYNYGEGVNSETEYTPGAFFQYAFSDGSRLNLIAGIRADHRSDKGVFITPRFHARYNLNEHTILRISAGKGYRKAQIMAENLSLLASSRNIVPVLQANEKLKMEEAWNYGINLSRFFHINNRELSLNIDLYRTDFLNQVVIDRVSSSTDLLLYNLNGKSYSNSAQIEANYEILRGLDVTAAFRINDVKVTYNDSLQQRPLVNRMKGLLSFSYKPSVRWQYDLTGQFNGPSRLPHGLTIAGNGSSNTSPAYTVINAQITRNLKKTSLYLGGENLTNYMQHHPVLGASDPYGPDFDASVVWGPLMGIKIYAGLRYTID